MDYEERKQEIRELQKKLRERELNDLKTILELPEGRRFIWRLLGETQIFNLSFTGNSETFFREGKRAIGILIFKDLMKASPKSFLQMMNEAKSEAVSFQNKLKPSDSEEEEIL